MPSIAESSSRWSPARPEPSLVKAPKSPQDLLQRAGALQRNGRTKEAEALYRQLISRNAQHQEALSALGQLARAGGRDEEATRYLERAAAVAPDPNYLTQLGELYRRHGKLDLAAEAFGKILEVAPDFPDARWNLAVTLSRAGILADSLALLEEALSRGPDSAKLRLTCADLLLRLHRPAAALREARRAVELSPELASAHRQLGDVLAVCRDTPAAIASYRRALELEPSNYVVHSELIVAMLSEPAYDAQSLFAETRAWAKLHAEPLAQYIRLLANDRNPDRPLRVGYVSPDFRAHAMQQFLVPLLQNHDSDRFEVYLYSSVDRPDAETQWYRDFVGERFRDIRQLDDVRAAELVRSDRIDILVDLALHSAGGRLRLFACRPAPVQLSWLGYAGTTGLDSIDYRITDPFVDPPGTDPSVYSETCLHLPESLWGYAPLITDLEEGPVPALSTGYVTFGSQNSDRKLHDGVLTLWARILTELPSSRLFLYAEPPAQAAFRRLFERAGVAPERLQLGGRVARPEYLRRYQNIDVALDAFPFNGGTTTLDATWMGVPVVTLSGDSCLQRGGTSIAMNLRLPELIAQTEDEFVTKAVQLAQNLEHLSELRRTLRTRLAASALGNPPRFTGQLEVAYRDVWRRYCAEPNTRPRPA